MATAKPQRLHILRLSLMTLKVLGFTPLLLAAWSSCHPGYFEQTQHNTPPLWTYVLIVDSALIAVSGFLWLIRESVKTAALEAADRHRRHQEPEGGTQSVGTGDLESPALGLTTPG